MVSFPTIDAESQIAEEVLPGAPDAPDGNDGAGSDAEGCVDVAIGRVDERVSEALADKALVKSEARAVKILEAGTDDPKEDCWDAPVGVGRAADVELVK